MLHLFTRPLFTFRLFMFVMLFGLSGVAKAYSVSVAITPDTVSFTANESDVVYVALSVVKVNGDAVFSDTAKTNIGSRWFG